MADQLDPPHSSARISDCGAGLALRFISGKYQGGEFPLEESQQVIIGRSSDLDMVLVEEMVSRRHARIGLRDGVVTIEDLGSTNGTFVNGEKIERAVLREGDRVLIGTSILRLVTPGPPPSDSGRPRSSPQTARHYRPELDTAEPPRMSGSLEEIPLPDLMQLFGTSRKTGMLVLHSENNVGRIHLEEGLVKYAEIEQLPGLDPKKAVYRMIGWNRGHFALDPPASRSFDQPLGLSAQEVLMEGFRLLDEFNTFRDRLPALTSRLALRTPLEAPLHELAPQHLDVLQRAMNARSVQALLDSSPLSDLETAKVIIDLVKGGYLRSD
jgi:hypothetical protein